MVEIIIRVSDEYKAQILRELLASLDFVEAIDSHDVEVTETITEVEKPDFFALAGLWTDRDVDLESIRQQAWPGR
jgi:hypothetical protein